MDGLWHCFCHMTPFLSCLNIIFSGSARLRSAPCSVSWWILIETPRSLPAPAAVGMKTRSLASEMVQKLRKSGQKLGDITKTGIQNPDASHIFTISWARDSTSWATAMLMLSIGVSNATDQWSCKASCTCTGGRHCWRLNPGFLQFCSCPHFWISFHCVWCTHFYCLHLHFCWSTRDTYSGAFWHPQKWMWTRSTFWFGFWPTTTSFCISLF